MMVWMLEQSDAQVTIFGNGADAFRSVLAQGKANTIPSLFTRRRIFSGWSHGGRQHDIAEFISHLLHSCQALIFRGTWEARYSIGEQVRVIDQGICEQLVSLELPNESSWTLQQAIDSWGNQAHIHALVSAPQWLAVRLNRFQMTADGVVKVRSSMRWRTHVNVPLFSDGICTSHVTYSVKAMAIHIGAHVDSGHYRALLCSAVGELYYCDDNKKAKLLSGFDCVARDVYVVFLSRGEQ